MAGEGKGWLGNGLGREVTLIVSICSGFSKLLIKKSEWMGDLPRSKTISGQFLERWFFYIRDFQHPGRETHRESQRVEDEKCA